MKARGSFHDDDLLDPGINAYEMMKPTISKILNSAPLLGDDPSHAKRILSAALTRQEYGAAPWLTDRRFLFQDSDSRWRCPSECALMALRRLTIEIADFYKYMLVRQWRDVFPQLVPNRSMLGFAVEYAVTIELSRLGVVFPRAQNRALRMPENLPLHPLLNVGPVRDLQQGLWVPVQYNYPFINCVAVWHDPTVTHICAIQITIANDHSDSREGFFQDEWKKWRDAVGSNKSIEWSFAWIYGEFGRPQHKQYKRPRNRQDDAPPTHIAYKMAIEYVSPAVRAALEQALDRGRG
ncbi:hypothetical protein K435DRAFT_145869 [Dendrothele bispora CBS 962.96]|uniref:Uncharacterized protein n=1 Tax=Dendrothele bispora (strain CBS 962.96) TaxID=1314807 RepID=A0A4S8MPE1_DENBC|nr:hypothetical protein K435DRAFT_145869 [Dendrothele bispora CBS 962.96]